jgi:hypothetical protein
MEKHIANKTAKQKEVMIKLLETNYGNIRKAAKLAGISTRTHYRWCKEDNDYDDRTCSMKDICYRNIKGDLIESAMRKVEKGDSAVLNKMLGLFLKDLPFEMQKLSTYNNVPMRIKLKIAPHPNDFYSDDPMTQLAVKRYMQDKEKDGKLGELRQDLVQKYKDGTIGEGENI